MRKKFTFWPGKPRRREAHFEFRRRTCRRHWYHSYEPRRPTLRHGIGRTTKICGKKTPTPTSDPDWTGRQSWDGPVAGSRIRTRRNPTGRLRPLPSQNRPAQTAAPPLQNRLSRKGTLMVQNRPPKQGAPIGKNAAKIINAIDGKFKK